MGQLCAELEGVSCAVPAESQLESQLPGDASFAIF